MTNETIPEPGPARDRMVAEVVGWVFDGDTDICWDEFLMRSPSTNDADALAALEAWRLADPEARWYQIVVNAGRPGGRAPFHVCLFVNFAVWDADADTLPSAATAALLATGEGT